MEMMRHPLPATAAAGRPVRPKAPPGNVVTFSVTPAMPQ
jgi:hypothetical protein